MSSPVLVEAVVSIAVSVSGAFIADLLASLLKRLVNSRERTVALKLPSGQEIHLELDRRLSQDKVSELVASAVRSAQSGDEVALQKTVDASHAASLEARGSIRD